MNSDLQDRGLRARIRARSGLVQSSAGNRTTALRSAALLGSDASWASVNGFAGNRA